MFSLHPAVAAAAGIFLAAADPSAAPDSAIARPDPAEIRAQLGRYHPSALRLSGDFGTLVVRHPRADSIGIQFSGTDHHRPALFVYDDTTHSPPSPIAWERISGIERNEFRWGAGPAVGAVVSAPVAALVYELEAGQGYATGGAVVAGVVVLIGATTGAFLTSGDRWIALPNSRAPLATPAPTVGDRAAIGPRAGAAEAAPAPDQIARAAREVSGAEHVRITLRDGSADVTGAAAGDRGITYRQVAPRSAGSPPLRPGPALVPWSEIEHVEVRTTWARPAAMTTALALGIVASATLTSAIVTGNWPDQSSPSGWLLVRFPLTMTAGVVAGAGIGSLVPRWKSVYRDSAAAAVADR